jgi:hypothetical protein
MEVKGAYSSDEQQAPVAADTQRQEKVVLGIGLKTTKHVIRQSPSLKEPTKTLRGALALVTRRKLLHQIRGIKVYAKIVRA